MASPKILIVHLNSNGDVLLATPIARQIKEVDFKGCHITWAVGTYCKAMLKDNPYIDEIIDVPLNSIKGYSDIWNNFYKKTIEYKETGRFDYIYYTQVIGDNKFSHYNGSLREIILKSYPKKITVPITPIITLDFNEVTNVKRFILENNISQYSLKILFECSPNCGQFNISPEIAVSIASNPSFVCKNICFIISSPYKIKSNYHYIIDGSVLTLRENAELTKYCDLLIGCSSGISWISRTTWAKPIPMIQLLNTNITIFNSFIIDHKRFNLDHSNILELYNPSPEKIIICLNDYVNNGIEYVIRTYQEKTKPSFFYYKKYFKYFLDESQYVDLLRLNYFHFIKYFLYIEFHLLIFELVFQGIRSKFHLRTRVKNLLNKIT